MRGIDQYSRSFHSNGAGIVARAFFIISNCTTTETNIALKSY
jgi:hypothetical protein